MADGKLGILVLGRDRYAQQRMSAAVLQSVVQLITLAQTDLDGIEAAQ